NAALKYYRAWLLVDTELADVLVTGDDMGLVEGGSTKLEAAGGSVLALLDAAEDGAADWDIAYEDGPEAEIPHLGKMRSSAKILAADALRCAEAGDNAGAAERAAAVYLMAGQVSEDRIMISSLVGMAIANLGNELTIQLIEEGTLDADGAAMVLTAIRGGDSDDRFGIRDAIVGEWRMISEYLVSSAPDIDAGNWLLQTMQMDIDDKVTKQVAQMDKQALLRELGGWSAFYGDMLSVWDSGDLDAMRQVVERVKDGDFGPLTIVAAPSLTRAFDSNQRSKEDFRALIERLEEIGG
ncbi:MAG: hypothetical protein KDA29_00995, partial [Phycisphaerales bacterium]|nr:hypothetical protein [Phycisphaerales bacterium]